MPTSQESVRETTPKTSGEPVNGEPAWWTAIKVALFIAVPGALMYLASALLQ